MKTVYTNDTKHDVWLRVTGTGKATLDKDAPPLEVSEDDPRTLFVEPGRTVYADGKVSVEPID